jgi:hypothetical protein
MSHENTITLKHDGKWKVVPSVVMGVQLVDRQDMPVEAQLRRLLDGNKVQPLAVFGNVQQADRWAAERSEEYGRQQEHSH